MDKDSFSYPKATYQIDKDSPQKNFNVSGNYFEFRVFVIPDTYASGSYRVDTFIEKQWVPKAFDED